MPNFDPARSLLRVAYQTIAGQVPLTGWRDVQMASEGFASTPGVVERTALSPVSLTALRGKTGNSPSSAVDALNPDDPGIAMLFPLDFVTTTNPAAGAFYHDLSDSGDDPLPGWISAKVWRDGELGHRWVDFLVNKSTITFAEDALIACTAEGVAAFGDYWEDGVQSAGAGTGTIRLRGVWDELFTGAGIQVKVTQIAPSLKIAAKRTAAGAYPAAQDATMDGWVDLKDEAGLLFGDLASPIQAHVAGAVAVNDVFDFEGITEAWVPTLPDPDHVVNEVYSRVRVDGADFVVKNGTLTLERPASPIKGFGGVRNAGTRRSGNLKPTLSLTRETLDESVRRRLETGAPFDFDLLMYSAVKIAATQLHYGIEINLAGLRASGSTSVVSGGDAVQQEQIQTTGGTLAIRIINSQAAIV